MEIVEISHSDDESKTIIEYDLENDTAVIKKYSYKLEEYELENSIELDICEIEALVNLFLEEKEE